MDGRARLYLLSALLALSGLGALAAYLFASNLQRDDIAAAIAAHRYAWYAPPLVVIAFVVFIPLSLAWLINRRLRAGSDDVYSV
jgi:uncharacterized membrane protein